MFVQRLDQLQKEIGESLFTQSDLRQIYTERSGLAHGQDFTGLSSHNKSLYSKLEEGVRVILKHAVLDASFRDIFSADAAVQRQLPLS